MSTSEYCCDHCQMKKRFKKLNEELTDSLSLTEIKRRLNLVNWYAYGFSSEDAVCMRDEVHEVLGIK